ncbi:MAG: hypothetical protein EBU90_27695 [Proteobacteria bacterium]|nr:hypothetical protein [Pseudomonadota bacterium]
MNNIKEKFIEVLGMPFNDSALDNYIEFVITNHQINSVEYSELHHIYPRSLFNDNLVYRLTYDDHVTAHQILSEAYPIREFLRPLNFMLKRGDKDNKEYRKLLSLATKAKWKEFKLTPQYEIWRKKKSVYMSEYMKNGGSKYLSELRFAKEENRNKVSTQFKELWQDDEYRKKVINSMIEERNSVAGKQRMKNSAKMRWENLSQQQRIDFTSKMLYINSDEEKRQDASEKIKNKWQDPEFKKKMANRKTRGSDGSAMSKKWQDPIFREKMLLARKKHETN